jgi:GMP synthase-like glutamine amidotransferase
MDAVSSCTLPAVHYDQVIEPPSDTRVAAGNELCPYAVLSYTKRRAVSLQAHPEFALEYVSTLIDRRERRGVMSGADADAARSSLQQPSDGARVGLWIERFLTEGGD